MEKTANVFIITKEGRSYSDEGLNYVTDVLKKYFNVTDELIFCMGFEYNDPKFLCQELKQNPDSYIVISRSDGIQFLPTKDVSVACQMLTDHPDESSWELFVKYCKPPKQSDN
jgi:hypothetical protein